MPRIIKKKGKKKNVAVETEVADRLSDIKGRLKEKQKTVLAYGIAAAAVVLIVCGILIFRYTQAEKSRQLEFEAYKTFYNKYQKVPLSGQAQYQKALDLFKQAYEKKKSARLLYYIASSYAELGRYDDALKSLNDLTSNYASEKDITPLAYMKIADVHMKKGNKEEALKTLDALYKSNGNIYKDLALVEAARILEGEGKKDEAAAKYKEIAEKFKDSPFIGEAKGKLGEKKEG